MTGHTAQSNAHAPADQMRLCTVPSEALSQIMANPALCAGIVAMVDADGECGIDGWELWRLSASTVCVQRVLGHGNRPIIVTVGVER